MSDLQALGRFLLSLQQPDGSFAHRYTRDTGPVTDWESLYYPGEAALGLIRLYELDGARQWLLAAERALAFLARSRAADTRVPPDDWAMIATAELLPVCERAGTPVHRDLLLHHAVQVVTTILQDQNMGADDPELLGSFDSRGRTSPTATSLEGLLAASTFLPPGNPVSRPVMLQAITRGITYLLRAQITSGPYSGALPASPFGASPAARSLRIDFTQDTLSAYIRFLPQ